MPPNLFLPFNIATRLINKQKVLYMKYLVGASLLTFALVGCNSAPQEAAQETTQDNAVTASAAVEDQATASAPVEAQVINFTGPMDLTIELKSSDNFETADLTDNSGKVHHLTRAVSGSGVRLANDEGVSIHFKAGEGVVELVKDKPINITEFKK